MYVPATETYYVMDMLDYSDYRPDTPMSLDRLVTETYGRKYEGQQTGDMLSNDTWHIYDMDAEEVENEVYQDEQFEEYKERQPPGYVPRYFQGMLPLRKWLVYPDGEYDFDHIRIGPSPRTMLAYLIRDGHLPHGKYLMRVSW